MSDTAGAWCVEFKNDSTRPSIPYGEQVTIVFPDSAAPLTLQASVRERRGAECWAAFPQPRWFDYTAYDLQLERPLPDGAHVPTVGLIVDRLDGLEVKRCAADEGEHFTVWDGGRRVWHEYYDWGAFTDPTCRPEETAQLPGS